MTIVYLTTQWKPALFIAMGVGLAGIISTYLAIKIDFLWMKLAWLLSLIVPNILLSIVFYLLLTPIALLSRLFKKIDDLSLKNTSSTLFKDTNKHFDENSFKNPW